MDGYREASGASASPSPRDMPLLERQIQAINRFPDQNPHPVMRIDPDGLLLYANRSSAPIVSTWGVTVGDALEPDLARRLLEAADAEEPTPVEIAVPPLADRSDDAVLLARYFARIAAERFGRPGARMTEAATAAIRAATWPDEVRGLALAVERAVLLSEDGMIDAAALAMPAPVAVATFGAAPDANFDLSDAERVMIEAALREHRHNVTHAAAALGLSRGALYRRMARYGL